MEKSKIASRFIEFFLCRPLVIPAVLIILVDLIYVNLRLGWEPTLNPSGQQVQIQGFVRDKAFDDKGNIKSITISDTICYVNNIGAPIGSFIKLSGRAYPMEGAMNRCGFDQKKYYA